MLCSRKTWHIWGLLEIKLMKRALSYQPFHEETKLKSFKDIPGPPHTPIFNNMFKNVDRKTHKYLIQTGNIIQLSKALWDDYGDFVKLEVIGRPPTLFVFHPQYMEQFLRAAGTQPVRPGLEALNYRRETDASKGTGPAEIGLLTSKGDEWESFRSKVQQPMLKPRAAIRYTSDLEGIAMEFINNKIRKKQKYGTLEVNENFINDLYQWALESVVFLALDTELGCLNTDLSPDSEQKLMIKAVSDIFSTTAFLEGIGVSSFWKLLPSASSKYRSFSKAYDVFYENASKHIKAALERHKNNIPVRDKERTLLERFYEHGCDEETATVMALDMMFAGIDTSSHLVSFVLYLLAKNPDVQEKLFQEIIKHLPTPESILREQSLEKMPYLRGVLKEGLRLHPPAIGNARKIKGPVEIGGYLVDRECVYFGLNCLASTSPRFVKDPLVFRPERWIRNHELKEDLHPFTFMPFGYGTRMCIGKRFALLESSILICKLVQHLRIEWAGERDLGMITLVITKPDGPLMFRFIDR